MRMEKFEYEFVKETGVRVVVGIRKDSCAGVHRSFSVLQISSFRLS
jgi:tartrate dehydratase beta subunit/fumarate hydratase class I family protein